MNFIYTNFVKLISNLNDQFIGPYRIHAEKTKNIVNGGSQTIMEVSKDLKESPSSCSIFKNQHEKKMACFRLWIERPGFEPSREKTNNVVFEQF